MLRAVGQWAVKENSKSFKLRSINGVIDHGMVGATSHLLPSLAIAQRTCSLLVLDDILKSSHHATEHRTRITKDERSHPDAMCRPPIALPVPYDDANLLIQAEDGILENRSPLTRRTPPARAYVSVIARTAKPMAKILKRWYGVSLLDSSSAD
ncbi:hypothetical protein C8R45DRAFT_1006372 [Mycena sanguinolenta]|nr:hypothetical protein C8R45DRAFT_1006372 [Mycena sanguinolenta]